MMDTDALLQETFWTLLHGTKRSPQQFLDMVGLPGRVAPQEGHGAGLDAGDAGLPIQEGCSSTAAMEDQDGQSDPCDI